MECQAEANVVAFLRWQRASTLSARLQMLAKLTVTLYSVLSDFSLSGYSPSGSSTSAIRNLQFSSPLLPLYLP